MYLWLFIAYVAGSAATFFLMYNIIASQVVEKCITDLIENGFLKTKKVKGEVEILKIKES
jgi:hypothetical protein